MAAHLAGCRSRQVSGRAGSSDSGARSRLWSCWSPVAGCRVPGAHADVCDLAVGRVVWLGSGCRHGEGPGRQASSGMTPAASARAVAASGPGPSCREPGTVDRSCEGEPAAAQRGEPGRIGELRGDQPADLGSQHIGQRQGQTGKGPIEVAEQPIPGRRAQRDPTGPRRRPGSELTKPPATGRGSVVPVPPTAARSSPAGRSHRS